MALFVLNLIINYYILFIQLIWLYVCIYSSPGSSLIKQLFLSQCLISYLSTLNAPQLSKQMNSIYQDQYSTIIIQVEHTCNCFISCYSIEGFSPFNLSIPQLQHFIHLYLQILLFIYHYHFSTMYTQQPHNTNNKKIPVLLVRHAQSLQNMGKRALMQTLTPQQKLNLQENPRYKQFSYRAEFLDADLSQLGFQQARQAREVMKNYDVDIVIVSPLKRALQTCQIIFQGRQGIKVFVQPLLGESLTAACDIGSCIQQSLEKYRNKYSFDKLSDSQWKTWYIDNIQNSEIRQKILKYNNKQKTTHQYVLELLRSHGKLQTQKQLKDRCIKLKQQIQIYSKQKKGVAIVAHYHLLKHLSCTRYNQEFKPIQCVQLWNAQIQRFLLSTQQQVQEQHNHNQEQINQQINEQVV